jgi:hypothetical protein
MEREESKKAKGREPKDRRQGEIRFPLPLRERVRVRGSG